MALRALQPTLVIVVIFAAPLVFAQPTTPPLARPDPLWERVIVTGGLGAAVAAIVTLCGTLWGFRQQRKRIDQEVEVRLKAEARTEAARLRSRFVNALPFHTRILRDHLSDLARRLAHPELTNDMVASFVEIKRYGARQLSMSAEAFSADCHYKHIFAMSTLYYTSVFLFFSQRIRSLAPFSEVEPELDKRLNLALRAVSDAFVSESPASGLWEPVQNSMGAIVSKDEWYLSYPDFCTIFVDIERFRRNGSVFRRDDHAFMRALDFFGAFDHPPHPPRPLITEKVATSVVRALDFLLEDVKRWREDRESPARSRRKGGLSAVLSSGWPRTAR